MQHDDQDFDAPPDAAELAAMEREEDGAGAEPDGALAELPALRDDGHVDAAFTAQVMARVGERRPGLLGRLRALLLRPRTLRYNLAAALSVAGAAAAGLLVLVPAARGRGGADDGLPAAVAAAGRRAADHVASRLVPVHFQVTAPGAARAGVAGDFDGWEAASLPLADPDGDGIWSAVTALPPGRHAYAFLVDGRRWVVDPDVAELEPDGFGGQDQVMVVAGAPVASAEPAPDLPGVEALGPVRAELAQVIGDLERAGLPADLVVAKVREGLAKGAGAADVLATGRGVAASVRLVAAIARKHEPGRIPDRALVRAAVAARRAGVPLPYIDLVVGATSGSRRASAPLALDAAARLVGEGYPAARSIDLVTALALRDTRASDLPRAFAVVEAAADAGRDRSAALAAVTTAVERGEPLLVAGEIAMRDGP